MLGTLASMAGLTTFAVTFVVNVASLDVSEYVVMSEAREVSLAVLERTGEVLAALEAPLP